MKKILIITLVSLIINTNIIYAECTTKDYEYFKSIEDKYQTSYEFNKETKTYSIKLTYGDTSTFIYDIENKNIEDATLEVIDNKLVVGNLVPGEYTIRLVGGSDSCNDTFKTEKITLPKYNQYAYAPECEGIEEFVLCSPTYDKYIDYSVFLSRVNTYKKNKENNSNNNNDNEKEKTTILEWMQDNIQYIIYAIIGIIVLFIIALIIKVIYNKERKRRRLE